MPILSFETTKSLDADMAQDIAKRLTHATATCLGKDPAVTVVQIKDGRDSGRWFVAGSTGDFAPVARLDIQITEGTNSSAEKAAWLQAVASILGISEASDPHYLTVTEVPGTDWGFNGISQTARKGEAR